jgi:hypothetical protein
MEAVIVTCLADRLQFLILCRTMDRYLQPCDFTIIINEQSEDFQFLKSWIENVCLKYIPYHNVQILSPEEILPDINQHRLVGWKSQQLLKIFYFKKSKFNSYCVLDSKNWFVKNCSIDEVAANKPGKLKPPNVPMMVKHAMNGLRHRYSKETLEKITNFFIPHETPYLMKNKVVKSMIKFFMTEKKFIVNFKRDQYPSEFMLHYFFDELDHGENFIYKVNRIHRTIWKVDKELYNLSFLELWNQFHNSGEFLVLGIHKSALKQMPLGDFKEVLKTLNLKFDDEIKEILDSLKIQNVPALK